MRLVGSLLLALGCHDGSTVPSAARSSGDDLAHVGAGDVVACPPPGDRPLPDGGGYPSGARVVSTGTELVVLWYERGAEPTSPFVLRFARLDADGDVRRGSERVLFAADGASRGLVQVVVGEGELGLVYKRWTQETRARRPRPIPQDGPPPPGVPDVREPLPDPEPTTETVTTSHRAYFARLGFDGVPRGNERPVSPRHEWTGDHADLAWDATRREWGVIFGAREPSGASPTVHFTRLDAEGEPVGDPVRLDSGVGFVEGGRAIVARAEGGFVAVWRGERAELGVLEPHGDALRARTRPLPVGPLGVTIATSGPRVAVAGAGPESPPRVTVALFESDAAEVPFLQQTVGAADAFSGSSALRFDGETLELVFVETFPRQSSVVVAHRFDPRAPEAQSEREVLVESGWTTSLGWPFFVGPGCPHALSYLRFGEGAQNRLHSR